MQSNPEAVAQSEYIIWSNGSQPTVALSNGSAVGVYQTLNEAKTALTDDASTRSLDESECYETKQISGTNLYTVYRQSFGLQPMRSSGFRV